MGLKVTMQGLEEMEKYVSKVLDKADEFKNKTMELEREIRDLRAYMDEFEKNARG